MDQHIRERHKAALAGEDPFQIEALHQKMDRTIQGYPHAKAALDIACHDLIGKALRAPATLTVLQNAKDPDGAPAWRAPAPVPDLPP